MLWSNGKLVSNRFEISLTFKDFCTLEAFHPPIPLISGGASSAYLMVNDAAVSLEGRRVRLGHSGRGFGGALQLLAGSGAGVVGLPGGAVEAAVVHQEQAGAQKKHEKHRDPMTLTETQTHT